MRKHIQALGILNIVWGSFGLIAALILMIIFGGVIGIIQTASHRNPDALFAVPIIGLIGGIILVVVLIASIPAIVTGIGLLRMTSWSRILTIIVSALHLFSVPFGTALGIYGLWVMLSDETVRLLSPGRDPLAIR